MSLGELYIELKGRQTSIGSLFGFAALMVAALWNFRLNRRRDAELRADEALSVAAELHGEILLLRKELGDSRGRLPISASMLSLPNSIYMGRSNLIMKSSGPSSLKLSYGSKKGADWAHDFYNSSRVCPVVLRAALAAVIASPAVVGAHIDKLRLDAPADML